MSGDVLLQSLVYHLVAPESFVQASALLAAIPEVASMLSAELGELMRALGAPLVTLFWVSLGTVSTASGLTLCLPRPVVRSVPLLVLVLVSCSNFVFLHCSFHVSS
jgi:hypothetical protein